MQIAGRLSEELYRLFSNIGHAAQHGEEKPLLSPVSFSLLAALSRRPHRASDLTGLSGLDQSTMSRRISTMCEHGIVERVPDPADGRAHLIRPTAAGLDLIARERERRVRTITDVLEAWPDGERADLVRLIAHLNDSLEASRPAARQGEK
nr:MarR family winged helix-turn-helix transcriptional regulator [Tessaracoccus coleopterorum]